MKNMIGSVNVPITIWRRWSTLGRLFVLQSWCWKDRSAPSLNIWVTCNLSLKSRNRLCWLPKRKFTESHQASWVADNNFTKEKLELDHHGILGDFLTAKRPNTLSHKFLKVDTSHSFVIILVWSSSYPGFSSYFFLDNSA